MRTSLLLLLVAVSVVVLWAIWTQSYNNTLVFTLGLLATGLCGYLIGDYFFNTEKKAWLSDIELYKKEKGALSEELDILRKQAALATPQTEIDAIKTRNITLEEEKNKLTGEFNAQAATIAALNVRVDNLQKENNKLKEDIAISSETRSAEIEAIRDTLTTTKTKISELAAENETLKTQLKGYEAELANIQNELENAKNSVKEKTEQAIAIQGIVEELPRQYDDLKVIIGINEKTETILQQQGITSWNDLADISVENLRDILQNAGEEYQLNDPVSWPQQARLLANGDLEMFKNYVTHLHIKKENGAITEAESINTQMNTPISESSKPEKGAKRIPLFYNYDTETNDKIDATADDIDEDDTPMGEASSASDAEQPTISIVAEEKNYPTIDNAPTIVAKTISLSTHPVYGSPDNLKAIEGIGPKIEVLLKEAGINTWFDLSEASVDNIKGVLDKAGSRYRLNDPTTWPTQAHMLANGDWDKFKEYTDELTGGRTPIIRAK